MDMIVKKTQAHLTNGSTVPTQMKFDPGKPVQVEFTFSEDEDFASGTRWLFARHLLYEGLSHGSGEGDVRVDPMPDGRVRLRLSSPYGKGEMFFDQMELVSFVARSYLTVSREQESEIVARELDTWFRKMLESE